MALYNKSPTIKVMFIFHLPNSGGKYTFSLNTVEHKTKGIRCHRENGGGEGLMKWWWGREGDAAQPVGQHHQDFL